jgi:L-asparagine transporter-like permease
LFLPYLPFGEYVVEEVFDSNSGKSSVFKLLNICIAAILAKLVVYISCSSVYFRGVFYTLRRRKIIAIEKENKEKQITEAKKLCRTR